MSPQILARIAWSVIAEPDDDFAAEVTTALGYPLSFQLITSSPSKARSALQAAGYREESISPALIRWLPKVREVDHVLKIIERLNIEVHTPRSLPRALNLPTPPPVLYTVGDASLLNSASIAVVAGDPVTGDAQRLSEQLLPPLSTQRTIVTSDRREDIPIHSTALSSGGDVIVVFAGGIDQVQRVTEARMFRQVAEAGLIVSAAPPGTLITAAQKKMQNELLAGISEATLVLTGAHTSQSVAVAETARRIGRAVGAVPGHALDPATAGTADLLRSGATLITSAGEALDFALTNAADPARV